MLLIVEIDLHRFALDCPALHPHHRDHKANSCLIPDDATTMSPVHLIALTKQQQHNLHPLLVPPRHIQIQRRGIAYPATSLTMSLTNVVLLEARPFVLEMRSLGW
jgi:hypothetical protein